MNYQSGKNMNKFEVNITQWTKSIKKLLHILSFQLYGILEKKSVATVKTSMLDMDLEQKFWIGEAYNIFNIFRVIKLLCM